MRTVCFSRYLVPRTRSAHHLAAGTVASLRLTGDTRITDVPVSLSIPKFARKSRQMLANFAIGTLGAATSPAWPTRCACCRRRSAATDTGLANRHRAVLRNADLRGERRHRGRHPGRRGRWRPAPRYAVRRDRSARRDTIAGGPTASRQERRASTSAQSAVPSGAIRKPFSRGSQR
jgi:hypothetical protein